MTDFDIPDAHSVTPARISDARGGGGARRGGLRPADAARGPGVGQADPGTGQRARQRQHARHPRTQQDRAGAELRPGPGDAGGGPVPAGAQPGLRQAARHGAARRRQRLHAGRARRALSARSAQVGFVYLQQFAPVEAAHRDFLRSAIQAGGGTPIGPNPGGYKADFGDRPAQHPDRHPGGRGEGRAGPIWARRSSSAASTPSRRRPASTRPSAATPPPSITCWAWTPGRAGSGWTAPPCSTRHAVNNFEHWQTPEQILEVAQTFYA